MQLAAAHFFQGAAQQGRVMQGNVGIDKEDILGIGHASAGVAADGGQSAGNHADVETVAHGEGEFNGAVG
jgi:hypothetical protein